MCILSNDDNEDGDDEEDNDNDDDDDEGNGEGLAGSQSYRQAVCSQIQLQCTTFYSVSLSEPIPVWFRKIFNFIFIKFSEPNPVRFRRKIAIF